LLLLHVQDYPETWVTCWNQIESGGGCFSEFYFPAYVSHSRLSSFAGYAPSIEPPCTVASAHITFPTEPDGERFHLPTPNILLPTNFDLLEPEPVISTVGFVSIGI